MVWAVCISGNCWNGTGTFADPDGWTYVGEFLDGKKHGKGTSTCGSECEPVEMVGAKYVGDFRDGNAHGEGTRTLPDGEKYVGEWRDSVFHGEGTKTFADGTVKTGFWHHLEYFETKAEWDALVEKVRLTKEQAEQGDADAQYGLGSMYANQWRNNFPYNRAIPQDYVEAVKWYTLAAEQGYAQTTLGYMYVKGHGVEVNYSKADLLFKEDMENEEAKSLLNYTPWARLGIYTAENAFGYGLPLAALLILLHIFAMRRGWPDYLRFFTLLLCGGFIGLGLVSYLALKGWLFEFFGIALAVYGLIRLFRGRRAKSPH